MNISPSWQLERYLMHSVCLVILKVVGVILSIKFKTSCKCNLLE